MNLTQQETFLAVFGSVAVLSADCDGRRTVGDCIAPTIPRGWHGSAY